MNASSLKCGHCGEELREPSFFGYYFALDPNSADKVSCEACGKHTNIPAAIERKYSRIATFLFLSLLGGLMSLLYFAREP